MTNHNFVMASLAKLSTKSRLNIRHTALLVTIRFDGQAFKV